MINYVRKYGPVFLKEEIMAKLKCPKCRSTEIDLVGGKMKTTLNLNPLHPFTLVNHTPKGKQEFHCRRCGTLFKAKL